MSALGCTKGAQDECVRMYTGGAEAVHKRVQKECVRMCRRMFKGAQKECRRSKECARMFNGGAEGVHSALPGQINRH